MEAIIDYRGKTPRKTHSGTPLITARIVKDGRIMTPTEFIRPIVKQIIENIHESRTLAQIRDTLLPKLLSGEIRVDDAAEILEEV